MNNAVAFKWASVSWIFFRISWGFLEVVVEERFLDMFDHLSISVTHVLANEIGLWTWLKKSQRPISGNVFVVVGGSVLQVYNIH